MAIKFLLLTNLLNIQNFLSSSNYVIASIATPIIFVILTVFLFVGMDYMAKGANNVVHLTRGSRHKKSVEYSNYYYEGKEKLFPSHPHFSNDGSWTEEKLNEFWFNYFLACSNYNYNEKDKLTPLHRNFIDNPSWTNQSTRAFYTDVRKRSQYGYYGFDKLYPDNEIFLPNPSWTHVLTQDYFLSKIRDRNRRSNRNIDDEYYMNDEF